MLFFGIWPSFGSDPRERGGGGGGQKKCMGAESHPSVAMKSAVGTPVTKDNEERTIYPIAKIPQENNEKEKVKQKMKENGQRKQFERDQG